MIHMLTRQILIQLCELKNKRQELHNFPELYAKETKVLIRSRVSLVPKVFTVSCFFQYLWLIYVHWEDHSHLFNLV